MLVNTGRAIITNRIKGSGTEPNYAGIGTGAGTTAAADTTLFTEVETRVAGTSTQQTTTTTNDTYRVVATITLTAGRTITNCGLFDAVSSGNLFVKQDIGPLTLASGDSIEFTYNTRFS
jgi:hypothetical protein